MMVRTAVLDGPNECYRYELRRIWDDTKSLLVVCMLNPSTADATKDDPTLLTLIHFAQLWGYGGLLIVNLFALRSPSPEVLLANEHRFGPRNGDFVAHAMGYANSHGGRLLAAWGRGGELDDRAEWFCSRALFVWQLKLLCLGTTKDWHPKHPMARGRHRISRDQQPIIWREPLPERAAS